VFQCCRVLPKVTCRTSFCQTAPAQARNLLGTVKRLFAWALDQDNYGLSASPAEALKPSKIIGEKLPRDRIPSDMELFALWRAAAGRLTHMGSLPNSHSYCTTTERSGRCVVVRI